MPEVLRRFQAAMVGMGKVVGPDEDGLYVWRTRGFEEAQATIALLWRFLGPVKRRQARAALREVVNGYRLGQLKARKTRPVRLRHPVSTAPAARNIDEDELERAWAAGFLDAEGCFGCYRSRARKGGPDWYRIRVSAAQHGEIAAPADVLIRLQRVFGGLGRIERHGDPDDFRWTAEGTDALELVLTLTREWLGQVKRDQADVALRHFRSQIRLKGDGTHCVRGHQYSAVRMRGGRLRKICLPCDRINSRKRRAAAGISPRQFRNVARRYTF